MYDVQCIRYNVYCIMYKDDRQIPKQYNVSS